jgi:hypothetical protein
LSTRWHFKSIRKLAIDYLSKEERRSQLNGSEWISLARELKIPDFLIFGCEELVKQIHKQPLTLEEATLSGLATCHELNGVVLRRYQSRVKPQAVISQKDILTSGLLKSEYDALDEELRRYLS